MFDTIIRGGAVVDGRGGAPFTADIGIKNGRIAEVGKVTAPAAREIDAEGAVVTPGFIDVTRKCPSLVAHLHPGDPIHVLNLAREGHEGLLEYAVTLRDARGQELELRLSDLMRNHMRRSRKGGGQCRLFGYLRISA